MPALIIVRTGDVYGKLRILSEIEPTCKKGQRRVRCECECGVIKDVNLCHLRSGATVSCRCYGDTIGKEVNRTHGEGGSQTYKCWSGMIQRCTNKNNPAYSRYGGKGIAVCQRWLVFKNFLADMGRSPSENHSIDRYPDRNGGYVPGNCRWATDIEQMRNKDNNVWVDYNGEQRLLIEVCEELGMRYGTVNQRRQRGWPDSDLFKPVVKPFGGPSIEVGAAI